MCRPRRERDKAEREKNSIINSVPKLNKENIRKKPKTKLFQNIVAHSLVE